MHQTISVTFYYSSKCQQVKFHSITTSECSLTVFSTHLFYSESDLISQRLRLLVMKTD